MAYKLLKKLITGLILIFLLLLSFNISLGLANYDNREFGSLIDSSNNDGSSIAGAYKLAAANTSDEPKQDDTCNDENDTNCGNKQEPDRSNVAATQTPFPTPTPLPDVNNFDGDATLTFLEIGEPTFDLHYPDIKSLYVNFPDAWQITGENEDTYFVIHYDLFENDNYFQLTDQSIDSMDLATVERPGVEIYMNDYLVGYFTPEVGVNNYATVMVPDAFFTQNTNNPENSYDIRVEFTRSYENYCGYDGVLTVYSDSYVNVNFYKNPQYLSLDRFPRGFLQNSIYPEKLYVVIPDEFSESDLRAAAIVAANLGERSKSNITLKVVRASNLDKSTLCSMSAIIIGQPQTNIFLAELYGDGALPTTLSQDGMIMIEDTQIGPQDGILQLASSNYCEIFSYLVVSGNSDEGVVRAARGLDNPLVVDLYGGYSVIKETNDPPIRAFDFAKDTFSFDELGYHDRTYYGLSTYRSSFSFYVPRDWELTSNPNIVLNYAHSSNLSDSGSSLNVVLNGLTVGAVPLSSARQGEKQASIPLQKSGIKPGFVNEIKFEAVLNGQIDCSAYETKTRWLTIEGISQLKIPHKTINQVSSLAPFLQPISYLANEPQLLISLPPETSQQDLNNLANFSLALGRQSIFFIPEITVSRDPQLDPAIYPDTNVIMFGKPTTNPQIAKINDALVQKFVPGEDALQEKVATTLYRVGEGSNIGIIEAIPAPWNPFKGVTVVTGTSDIGLNWAMEKVIDKNYMDELSGDLIFIVENNIKAFNTFLSMPPVAENIVSTMTNQTAIPVLVLTPTVVTTPTISETERYVRTETPVNKELQLISGYLLYGIIALGVIIFIIALASTIRGGRRR